MRWSDQEVNKTFIHLHILYIDYSKACTIFLWVVCDQKIKLYVKKLINNDKKILKWSYLVQTRVHKKIKKIL